MLCVQPALADIPNAKSYEQYVTLINDQAGEGGCIGHSYTHVLEILKEMEAPYTPDPSWAFHAYVFSSAREGFPLYVDPRVANNPNEGSDHIMTTYGAPPETSYPTNFDKLGTAISSRLSIFNAPSQTAFNEAHAYRLLNLGTNYPQPSVSQAEELLANSGPLVCTGIFPDHAVALIGYDRSAQEFTIIDSANWLGINHAGVKKVTYAYFASMQPKMTLTLLTNLPTPLVHPYTARIKIHHYYQRSMLTVKIGAVGEHPLTVWDQNNLNKCTDSGQDLTIDVPLPDYAAEHWPPSNQNQWYVQVTNHDTEEPAELQEVTLVKRYYPSSPSSNIAFDQYTQLGLPRLIHDGETSDIVFPNKITITSPNGGESWAEGKTHTITWYQTGLSGTDVKIELLKDGWETIRTIVICPADVGTYSWPVPHDFLDGTTYSVKITSLATDIASARVSDTSDGYLTFTRPTLDVTSPNGVDRWTGGTVHPITWTQTGLSGTNVKIELMEGNAVNPVRTIMDSCPADAGTYSWLVANLETGTDYWVKVTSLDATWLSDNSGSFRSPVRA